MSVVKGTSETWLSQCVENLLFWQREVFGEQGKLRTTLLEMRVGRSDLTNV